MKIVGKINKIKYKENITNGWEKFDLKVILMNSKKKTVFLTLKYVYVHLSA